MERSFFPASEMCFVDVSERARACEHAKIRKKFHNHVPCKPQKIRHYKKIPKLKKSLSSDTSNEKVLKLEGHIGMICCICDIIISFTQHQESVEKIHQSYILNLDAV
jgi:hypothetical protein